jgi:hypothetical protein
VRFGGGGGGAEGGIREVGGGGQRTMSTSRGRRAVYHTDTHPPTHTHAHTKHTRTIYIPSSPTRPNKGWTEPRQDNTPYPTRYRTTHPTLPATSYRTTHPTGQHTLQDNIPYRTTHPTGQHTLQDNTPYPTRYILLGGKRAGACTVPASSHSSLGAPSALGRSTLESLLEGQ